MVARALLVLLVYALCACASSKQAKWEVYGFVSLEEQMLEAVMAAPKVFILAPDELRLAEQRLELFLAERATERETSVLPGGGRIMFFTVETEGARRQFRIERKLLADGMRYSVDCLYKGDVVSNDELNARNLARFIKDGWLEPGLLKHKPS